MRQSKIPEKEWDGDLLIHNLPRPDGLIECKTVLDIGAGIRPMNWYKPESHICIEPFEVYGKLLKKAGYEIIQSTALDYLQYTRPQVEAIYLLDVIEHMEKEDGVKVVALALKRAKKQVIIFTPMGFMPQDEDVWGLEGHFWQTHRSGWMPEEFPGWQTQLFGRGFYAVFTK